MKVTDALLFLYASERDKERGERILASTKCCSKCLLNEAFNEILR